MTTALKISYTPPNPKDLSFHNALITRKKRKRTTIFPTIQKYGYQCHSPLSVLSGFKNTFRVIELEPEYTACQVVDGAFDSFFSHRKQGAKRSKRHSQSMSTSKKQPRFSRRIKRLQKNNIPLNEIQLKQFFKAYAKNKKALLHNKKISYPAGFRVNIGVAECFFEVHSPKHIFLVILDPDNKKAHFSGGQHKDLFFSWFIPNGKTIAYAVTDMKNSTRTFQQVTRREEKFLNELNEKTHTVKLLRTVYHDFGGRQVLMMKLYPTDMLEWCKKKINGVDSREYSPLEKVNIAIKLADTISYLHEHSVFHRDIKPENVLMDGLDVAITDFGLACEKESPQSINNLPGSLPYISCNSLRALYGGFTHLYFSPKENDIWGLGCLLWMLFAEQPIPWCYNLFDKKIGEALIIIKRLRDKKPKSANSPYGILWNLFNQNPQNPIDAKHVVNKLKALKKEIKAGKSSIIPQEFPLLLT
jgi:Protein kinase domain